MDKFLDRLAIVILFAVGLGFASIIVRAIITWWFWTALPILGLVALWAAFLWALCRIDQM